MFRTIIAGIFAATIAMALPQTVEAGHRGRVVSRRTVNSYQRDVRQFQRQSSRSFNQINRGFSRSIRQAPRVRGFAPRGRGFAPRSSGIYLGGSRGGVFLRF